MSNRPKPWSPAPKETIWVDYTTGVGVTSNGSPVRPKIGQRRQKPNLTDMLETALSYGAEIIRFCGSVPDPQPVEGKSVQHWLYVKTPGWEGIGHHPQAPATGRFRHLLSGRVVSVRLAAEWFGDVALTPAQAHATWNELERVLKKIDSRATAFYAPSRTGANLWALSLAPGFDPTPVTDDIAEELHATGGQHHLEHLVAGDNASDHDDCVPLIDPAATPKLDRFAYVDGRFMYAALGRELGAGPGIRLRRAEAYELMVGDPYARARFEVTFRVPDDWNHVGILGMQHGDRRKGWYYPNRPGATGTTWADAAEVAVALRYGWSIDPQQAVVFRSHEQHPNGSKGKALRPLDTWRDQLVRARTAVGANQDYHPVLRDALESALRSIVIQGIGYFASRGNTETHVVESALDVPAEYQATMKRFNGVYIFQVPSERNGQAAGSFYHPEYAAQIWARGRARVLSAPTAAGSPDGGALAVDPRTLIGINGDAIYTSEVPAWSLPIAHGGGDDGNVGRLRLKGVIDSTVRTPATLAARNALRARADKAGPAAAWANREETGDDA